MRFTKRTLLILTAAVTSPSSDHRFVTAFQIPSTELRIPPLPSPRRRKRQWVRYSNPNEETITTPTESILQCAPDDPPLFVLPRHETNENVNEIIRKTENILTSLYEVGEVDEEEEKNGETCGQNKEVSLSSSSECHDGRVYSNHYVDLGKIDTVGFDYDYTLVTYTPQLLDLIYSMALERLVTKYFYPSEMLQDPNLTFSPFFPIRGLAVDRENGWICHLSYTHNVALAFDGRNRVSGNRLDQEYRGKRSLTPHERKERLKPLNDLFSMAECCLIADVIQFFQDNSIPHCPRNAVDDVLAAIGATHISGDFHRIVAKKPARYFEPRPHLEGVLREMKKDGKRLILVSNSPFWYVDAGMRHVIGEGWREVWDAIIVSAGKPNFYKEEKRPFRMVDKNTGQINFKKITRIEPGEVYAEGCLKELNRCMDWSKSSSSSSLVSSNVLYIGDSLFADLVDAKRNYGWTTAAVIPEVSSETSLQRRALFTDSRTVIDLLVETLRRIQVEMGPSERSVADVKVLDELERTVSRRREEQNTMLGNPFGSIFRAQYQPSLFAHSLRRYCDLYMSNVSDLRHYSTQHRFYPDDARLLSHEMQKVGVECWDIFDSV